MTEMTAVPIAAAVAHPPAAPAAAIAVAPMISVTVPEGVQPGALLQITAPSGQVLQVAVPAGMAPGMTFQVQEPAAPVVVTTTTTIAPVNPIDSLMMIPGLFVKQKIELLEIMTGYETENKYKVYALDPDTGEKGRQMFKARERSECCERQYCGSSRGFTIEITTEAEKKLGMTFDREFACECFCACRSLLQVKNPTGQVIGEVYHPFACCETILDIRSPDGEIWYHVKSGCYCTQAGFFCKCPCEACQIIQFKITDESGKEVGMIERSWQGCGRALYTDSDNFHIVFPKEANAQQRATLFSAVFVVDFIHFEEKQNNNHTP